jgi:hypothetical protein
VQATASLNSNGLTVRILSILVVIRPSLAPVAKELMASTKGPQTKLGGNGMPHEMFYMMKTILLRTARPRHRPASVR